MVAIPTSAEAAPSNCLVTKHRSSYPHYVTVACGAGTGEFRAIAVCRMQSGDSYSKYGRWYAVGTGVSRANCEGDANMVTGTYETR